MQMGEELIAGGLVSILVLFSGLLAINHSEPPLCPCISSV